MKLFRILIIVALCFGATDAVAQDAKTASPLVGLWEGPLKTGSIDLRLGIKITAKPNGTLTATVDSIDQGAKNLPIDAVTFADGKLTLDATKLNAAFNGTLSKDGKVIKGEWTQGKSTLPLELVKVEKFSSILRPQMPKKPYPYDEIEVAVENEAADVKLAGTLTKPKGAGPFRAAILITGSGPQDRDETLLGHKPFLVLADHLTRKGIAVLRCDDRGVARSTGDHAKATSADFATDVRAQVQFLKKRKDIKGIGLIGHSEGGMIAPMVAADNADIAFIVLLAGPGVLGEDLIIMQGQALVKGLKGDEKALKSQRDLQTRLFKVIRGGGDAKAIKAEMDKLIAEVPESLRKTAAAQLQQSESLMTSPWLRYFLTHDPRKDLKNVRCPVLALNGEKDLQVPPKENLAEIEKALKDGANKNVTIREFANLNHLFQNCKTGLPDEYGKIEETISPDVLNLIGEWIVKQK